MCQCDLVWMKLLSQMVIFIHFPWLFEKPSAKSKRMKFLRSARMLYIAMKLIKYFRNKIIQTIRQSLWNSKAHAFCSVLFNSSVERSECTVRSLKRVSFLLQTFCYNIKLKVGYSMEKANESQDCFIVTLSICETINSLAKMKYLLI